MNDRKSKCMMMNIFFCFKLLLLFPIIVIYYSILIWHTVSAFKVYAGICNIWKRNRSSDCMHAFGKSFTLNILPLFPLLVKTLLNKLRMYSFTFICKNFHTDPIIPHSIFLQYNNFVRFAIFRKFQYWLDSNIISVWNNFRDGKGQLI